MGAFVSVPECQTYYNITLDCDYVQSNETGRRYQTIGGIEKGRFPGDPDVAGIGVSHLSLLSVKLANEQRHLTWKYGLDSRGLHRRDFVRDIHQLPGHHVASGQGMGVEKTSHR